MVYGGTYGYGWIYYGLGRIPYYVTPDFKQRTAAEGNGSHTPYEIFMDAIAYIKNEVACVDFFPFEGATTPYYVLVDYGASCQAEIGCRMKSGQKLDLGPYCTFKRGTVLHEIMHVLGFYHEHTRQDRDSEVTVHLENVETSPNDRRSNFDVVSTDFVDHSPVYDCGSVMHYTHNAYSTDKFSLDTITGKTTACRNVMGQRVDFSPIDKATLAAKYGPPCPA
ncbi:unnamed protein product [Owenia fusiformis]|uniref:Metalloendopeptidase n=1 Tax=Owenia fusiformis TaxID=6347 RepID=A0A8J1U8Z2_OWEFU|nr:unnamed protein product [Owenia fusiformis]